MNDFEKELIVKMVIELLKTALNHLVPVKDLDKTNTLNNLIEETISYAQNLYEKV